MSLDIAYPAEKRTISLGKIKGFWLPGMNGHSVWDSKELGLAVQEIGNWIGGGSWKKGT